MKRVHRNSSCDSVERVRGVYLFLSKEPSLMSPWFWLFILWRLSWWWSCFIGVSAVQTTRGKQFISRILWRLCTMCCKLFCFFVL